MPYDSRIRSAFDHFSLMIPVRSAAVTRLPSASYTPGSSPSSPIEPDEEPPPEPLWAPEPIDPKTPPPSCDSDSFSREPASDSPALSCACSSAAIALSCSSIFEDKTTPIAMVAAASTTTTPASTPISTRMRRQLRSSCATRSSPDGPEPGCAAPAWLASAGAGAGAGISIRFVQSTLVSSMCPSLNTPFAAIPMQSRLAGHFENTPQGGLIDRRLYSCRSDGSP